jgi:ribosomal protein S18 acetylase RimI-like enzyme
MQIRALRTEEAEAVLELWRGAEATPSLTDTVDDVRRMAERADAAFLVVELEERLVGSVIATFDGWRGHLYRLAVHPEYRRRGIARRLIRHAETTLSEWGVRRVSALVESDHQWAVSFWEAAGYTFQPKMARFVRNFGQSGSPA